MTILQGTTYADLPSLSKNVAPSFNGGGISGGTGGGNALIQCIIDAKNAHLFETSDSSSNMNQSICNISKEKLDCILNATKGTQITIQTVQDSECLNSEDDTANENNTGRET